MEPLRFMAECVYIACRDVIKNVCFLQECLRRHSWASDKKVKIQITERFMLAGDLKVDDESGY